MRLRWSRLSEQIFRSISVASAELRCHSDRQRGEISLVGCCAVKAHGQIDEAAPSGLSAVLIVTVTPPSSTISWLPSN